MNKLWVQFQSFIQLKVNILGFPLQYKRIWKMAPLRSSDSVPNTLLEPMSL